MKIFFNSFFIFLSILILSFSVFAFTVGEFTIDEQGAPQEPAGGGGEGAERQVIITKCKGTENWQCGPWSSCISFVQTRECEDINFCKPAKNETAVCIPMIIKKPLEERIEIFTLPGLTLLIVLLIIILLMIILIKKLLKRRKVKKRIIRRKR